MQVKTTETEVVEAGLRSVAAWAAQANMAMPELKGRLIRPIVALAGWRSISDEPPPPEFWYGAMAVQLAHEASLLHDDVIDESSERRGAPTVAAARGVGAALVQGDHLLTTAYRYAARTRSLEFVESFARSVERTVAGEIAQARATGRALDFLEYSSIVTGKSGELLGCALSLAPSLVASARAHRFHTIGCRIGLVYQMLDDLLDLSPRTVTGKPALADYIQRHWTWPLEHLSVAHFTIDAGSLLFELHNESLNGTTAARRCLARYDDELGAVALEIRNELNAAPALESLLNEWRERARTAVELEESAMQQERITA